MSITAPQGADLQSGVGLVEVLVAVLVMSLGFLYAANMQVRGMRANQAAYYHSQALMLAGDMMDRMRANPLGVAAGAYHGKNTDQAVTDPDCQNSGCSPAQMAITDLYDWRARLVDVRGSQGFVPLLPMAADGGAATGSIALQATGDYLISLDWQETLTGSDVARTVAVRFVP